MLGPIFNILNIVYFSRNFMTCWFFASYKFPV